MSGRLSALLLLCALPAAEGAERALERADLVATVAAQVQDLRGMPLDPRVRRALMDVPRHAFVPPAQRADAYQNRPLPIGYGQTISQPFIVALMTDLLDVGPGNRVLEIGTGSGYQAAVLARIVESVHSIEIVAPLGEQAARRLQAQDHRNVETRVGDGYFGWEEAAPFDAIIVTAAATHVPPPLVAQLAEGGRMLIPVGAPFQVQYLMVVEKRADGELRSRQILPVRFVPLTGAGERPR
ncbi:MAG TPA: protein-L-isoaspartate(D-aspartate) O-methyltransferase [Xanthomonadaceae bacterium]|nr:protein-L-isoaspartate(D-aspartate) O-methyltransferase [Xanthomonadaceae bacterium]